MATSAAAPALTPAQQATIDENRGSSVIAVSAFFIILCTLSVGFRFVARATRRMSLDIDDYLSLGALVFVIAFCAICIITVPYGMGKHAWATDPSNVWKIMRTGFFQAVDYTIVHWFIKMSILAFYKRIFTLNIRWFKYCIYALAAYTTAWSIGCLFAVIFQCVPPSLFWSQYNPALSPPPSGFCGVKYPAFVISSSALNSVGDVFIFALPLAMLWKLQLRRSQKFGLTLLFATGAFSIVASFKRLDGSLQAVKLDADTTWIMADLYIWTLVEAGVALTCSCLPVVGPIFSMVKDNIASYIASKYSKSGSNVSKEVSDGFQSHSVGQSTDSKTELRMKPDAIIRTDSFRMDSHLRSGDDVSAKGTSAWRLNQNNIV